MELRGGRVFWRLRILALSEFCYLGIVRDLFLNKCFLSEHSDWFYINSDLHSGFLLD